MLRSAKVAAAERGSLAASSIVKWCSRHTALLRSGHGETSTAMRRDGSSSRIRSTSSGAGCTLTSWPRRALLKTATVSPLTARGWSVETSLVSVASCRRAAVQRERGSVTFPSSARGRRSQRGSSGWQQHVQRRCLRYPTGTTSGVGPTATSALSPKCVSRSPDDRTASHPPRRDTTDTGGAGDRPGGLRQVER
jgi:hypothetical protein